MSADIDYGESAELYLSSTGIGPRSSRYMRFSSAAEAIRYAVEQIPTTTLRSAAIEAGDHRYEGQDIRALYDAPDYPLSRRA
jgi:hypothetical protein